MLTGSEECTFCNQYINCITPNFWATNWGRKFGQNSDIIYQSDSFLIVAGLGALSEGYVLLIPKPHHLSVAKLPLLMIDELEILKSHVRYSIEQLYGPAVFFEHGMIAKNKRGGACVEHVHIHAFSCEIDFRSSLKTTFSETRIQLLRELADFREGNSSYIFYENQEREMFVYETLLQTPSQYVRKLWGQALGKADEWDWAIFLNERNVANTIKNFRLFNV